MCVGDIASFIFARDAAYYCVEIECYTSHFCYSGSYFLCLCNSLRMRDRDWV